VYVIDTVNKNGELLQEANEGPDSRMGGVCEISSFLLATRISSSDDLLYFVLVLKHRLSEHIRYYFNYRLLKARVKVYTEQTKEGNRDRRHVLKDFSKLLDDEVRP
jgi:hypothetical protein